MRADLHLRPSVTAGCGVARRVAHHPRGIEWLRLLLRTAVVETVELQKALDERLQMLGRLLHAGYVEPLPMIVVEAFQQIGVAHDRSCGRFEVVRHGQHQMLAIVEQALLLVVGAFELRPDAPAAAPVAQYDGKKDEYQHDRRQRDHAQCRDGVASCGIALGATTGVVGVPVVPYFVYKVEYASVELVVR